MEWRWLICIFLPTVAAEGNMGAQAGLFISLVLICMIFVFVSVIAVSFTLLNPRSTPDRVVKEVVQQKSGRGCGEDVEMQIDEDLINFKII